MEFGTLMYTVFCLHLSSPSLLLPVTASSFKVFLLAVQKSLLKKMRSYQRVSDDIECHCLICSTKTNHVLTHILALFSLSLFFPTSFTPTYTHANTHIHIHTQTSHTVPHRAVEAKTTDLLTTVGMLNANCTANVFWGEKYNYDNNKNPGFTEPYPVQQPLHSTYTHSYPP